MRSTTDDWHNVDEVIVDIARDHLPALKDKAGPTRRPNRPGAHPPGASGADARMGRKAAVAQDRSAALGGLDEMGSCQPVGLGILETRPKSGTTGDLDLATDWSVYVFNRLAALQLSDMGVSRFALSPEDGLANWASLWREFGPRAVLIVYQDTPLFLAESCAYANLIGGCPGKANCNFQSMEMVSSHGEKVTALDYHCRTIVLNQGPFCLSTRLADLRRAGVRHFVRISSIATTTRPPSATAGGWSAQVKRSQAVMPPTWIAAFFSADYDKPG